MRSIQWLLSCAIVFYYGLMSAEAQQVSGPKDSIGGADTVVRQVVHGVPSDSSVVVKDSTRRGRHVQADASRRGPKQAGSQAGKKTTPLAVSADTAIKKKDTSLKKKDTAVVVRPLIKDSLAKISGKVGPKKDQLVLPEKEDSFLNPVLWIVLGLFSFLLVVWAVPAGAQWRFIMLVKGMENRGGPEVAARAGGEPLPGIGSEPLVGAAGEPAREKAETVEVTKRAENVVETVSAPFFVCEMMMTAGPRKKFMNEGNADKDLGEDVCGCVINHDKVGIWLLDGTSDQHCFRHPLTGEEYFSSRLLAQHIGDNLRKSFVSKDGGGSLGEMMNRAIEDVRQHWVAACNGLPSPEKLQLHTHILEKNYPECSSTLLTARLGLDGELEAYRSGDSKMLFFREDQGRLIPDGASFATKKPESNDRIFFQMIAGAEGQLEIICNKPIYELTKQENIHTLIGFSDGIGTDTEEALKEEYSEDPDSVRRRVIEHSQGTADDKSICFVRIK